MSSSAPRRARVLRGADVVPYRPEPLVPVAGCAGGVAGGGAGDGSGAGTSRPSRPGVTTAEQVREEAYRAGYQAALDEAVAQVAAQHAEATQRLARAAEALVTAACELSAQREKAVTVAEDDVTALAFEVAGAILDRELELASDPGREAVARALRLVPPQVEVTVRLHPSDLDRVREAMAAEVDEEDRLLSFVADDLVEPGGAVAEAGSCRVDAQISTALSRVRRALDRGQK